MSFVVRRARVVRKQDDADYGGLRSVRGAMKPEFKALILGGLGRFADSMTANTIFQAVRARTISGALLAFDWTTLGAVLVGELREAHQKALVAGGRLALRQFPGELAMTTSVRVAAIEEWAATRSALLVRQIKADTMAAIQETVRRTFVDFVPERQAVAEIRAVVGLTNRQAQAVVNFRRGLEDAIAEGKGIESLRRRFNLSRDVLRSDRQLRPGNVDRLTETYRQRYLTHRAQVIAGHEAQVAVTQGRKMMWEAMAEAGAIDPQRDLVEWLVVPDDRLCDICLPNHGERRRLGEPFPSGDIQPPAHVACRCDTRMVLEERLTDRPSSHRRAADRAVAEQAERLGIA